MEVEFLAGLTPILLAVSAFIPPLISLLTKNRYVYSAYLTVLSILTLVFTSMVFSNVVLKGKPIVYPFGGWPPPLGITYEVDFVSAILTLVTSILMVTVSVYSFWYYSKIERGAEWLTTLLLLLYAGIVGCLYTGDLFNFFVMLEVLCISSYALVAFFKKRMWAIEASTSYAFIGALATTLFLLGVIYIYASFGTLNMADIAAKSHGIEADFLYMWSGVCRGYRCVGNIAIASAIAVALMLWALTFKAGLFPNNFWVPGAYTEAPTPASALFAGIVDKVGTYGVLRIFFTLFTAYGSTIIFSISGIPFRDAVLSILSYLGLLTGYLGASFMAIQNDVKRLLAYSTISHIGIIFVALGATTSNLPENVNVLALTAIMFHMITHAIGEPSLFLSLGALATIAKSRRLQDMAGYGRLYPALGMSTVIGLLSLLGVLPLAGFFSKYMLFLALVDANLLLHAISIILISGISAIGYFRILYTLLILKPRKVGNRVEKEKVLGADIACLLLAILLIALGIATLLGYVIEPLIENVATSLGPKGYLNYIEVANIIAKVMSP